jgi:adenylate cyclase
MSVHPNKLSHFWKELKRRKVTRVITVYAASAFVILELVSIVVDPLRLPAWTLPLVIILLGIGFVLAIILSWIFDIHPAEGIVKTASAEKESETTKTKAVPSSRGWKIATYLSLFVIVVLIAFHVLPKRERAVISDKSIAVMPFEDMSSQQDQEYFCDGMAEGIINSLMQLEHLKVSSRTSTFAFKNRQLDIREIGKLLNVSMILEGSIQKSGNRLRITAQLINAADGSHVWSEQYDRDLKDVFAIQDEISSAIVNKLRIGMQGEMGDASSRHTSDLAAYNLYLKGRFYWYERTEKDMLIGKELYEQALQIDPGYALAYVGLADVYFIMTYWGYIPKKEGFEQAKTYIFKALDLNDRLPEAHATLGGILTWYDWDWRGAERELKKAISLNPNDAIALQYYSELLNILQRHDEAWTYLDRVLELNPHSHILYNLSASYHANDEEYEKAIDECLKALEIAPFRWPQLVLFNCNLKLGRDQQAISYVKDFISTNPRIEDRAILDRIYVESGMEGVLEWFIHWIQKHQSEDEYLRMESHIIIARYYAYLAEAHKAMEYLQRAYEEEVVSLPWIHLYPEFSILHDSARFQYIISEMGL